MKKMYVLASDTHSKSLKNAHTKKTQTVVKISNLIVKIYRSFQNTFAN